MDSKEEANSNKGIVQEYQKAAGVGLLKGCKKVFSYNERDLEAIRESRFFYKFSLKKGELFHQSRRVTVILFWLLSSSVHFCKLTKYKNYTLKTLS